VPSLVHACSFAMAAPVWSFLSCPARPHVRRQPLIHLPPHVLGLCSDSRHPLSLFPKREALYSDFFPASASPLLGRHPQATPLAQISMVLALKLASWSRLPVRSAANSPASHGQASSSLAPFRSPWPAPYCARSGCRHRVPSLSLNIPARSCGREFFHVCARARQPLLSYSRQQATVVMFIEFANVLLPI
jgi:hypothetical protein